VRHTSAPDRVHAHRWRSACSRSWCISSSRSRRCGSASGWRSSSSAHSSSRHRRASRCRCGRCWRVLSRRLALGRRGLVVGVVRRRRHVVLVVGRSVCRIAEVTHSTSKITSRQRTQRAAVAAAAAAAHREARASAWDRVTIGCRQLVHSCAHLRQLCTSHTRSTHAPTECGGSTPERVHRNAHRPRSWRACRRVHAPRLRAIIVVSLVDRIKRQALAYRCEMFQVRDSG
jgi:hypothetical protein